MYKSIQHFLDNNIENIQKRIRNQIVEGQDIGQISKGLHSDLLNLGTSMIAEILEDMDHELRVSEERKKNYEIVNRRHNSFLTK
ncbi:MAG: ISLre2 family transposase, partial [Clostridia bacterium]|nr:ISLre2 family transposase [Clostridia bacterium]MDD3971643.1 ISLre2 family transposase [Clostridia bacterium]